ncbi:MAG: Transcriptional regulator [Pseudonocardiales bacterium]|nr:Transcriptional regulator [Pseudonocardiales bacterium]
MLTEAVRQEVAEGEDLDWKSELPSEKDLAQSDTVKDIAAKANSGGGAIVQVGDGSASSHNTSSAGIPSRQRSAIWIRRSSMSGLR